MSDVLALLGSWDPAPPRLTWYGTDGERVELSGRTLRTWVVKAANLLHVEADVDTSSRVGVALPPHWRALVWDLAVRALGAEPVLDVAPDDAGDWDALVTHRPQHASADVVLAVPLPALAMSWSGDLPDGALDGAAELMAQPDDPVFAPPPPLRDAPDGGPRVLLLAEAPVAEVADRAWQAWSAGGSVVLATQRTDAELARIAEQESATVAGRNVTVVRRTQRAVDGRGDRASISEVLREGRAT